MAGLTLGRLIESNITARQPAGNRQRRPRSKPVPSKEAVRVCAQVCPALTEAGSS